MPFPDEKPRGNIQDGQSPDVTGAVRHTREEIGEATVGDSVAHAITVLAEGPVAAPSQTAEARLSSFLSGTLTPSEIVHFEREITRGLKRLIDAEKEKQEEFMGTSFRCTLAHGIVEFRRKIDQFSSLVPFFQFLQRQANTNLSGILEILRHGGISLQVPIPFSPPPQIDETEQLRLILEQEKEITPSIRTLSEQIQPEDLIEEHSRTESDWQGIETIIKLLIQIWEAAGFKVQDPELLLIKKNQDALRAFIILKKARIRTEETQLFQPDRHTPPPTTHSSESNPDSPLDFWGRCSALARRIRLTRLAAFFESKRHSS